MPSAPAIGRPRLQGSPASASAPATEAAQAASAGRLRSIGAKTAMKVTAGAKSSDQASGIARPARAPASVARIQAGMIGVATPR